MFIFVSSFMGYFTGAGPITDSMTLGAVGRVGDWGKISRKKHAKDFGQFHLPQQDVVHPGLS